MKVELIKNEETEKEIEYPCLMVHENNGCVILFESEGFGVVVNPDKHLVYAIGYYSKDWKMSCFSEFKGKVILQND